MGTMPVKHSAQCVVQRKGLGDGEGGTDPDLPGSSTEEGTLEHDSYIPGWGNCLYFLETPGVQSSWNVGQEGRT